jgi:SOS-response transcriptional repressor LexA
MAVRWVPYVGDVGAGPAILQYEEGAVELFPVPVRLLHPATSPIVVSVGRGQESMSPTLLPGDWVVVDRAPIRRTDPKDIYLIRDPDEPEAALALKRVIAAGAHTVILLSDNPAFEPRRIRLPGNMSPADILVGRVALVLRPMAPARRPRKRKKTQPTEEARVS